MVIDGMDKSTTTATAADERKGNKTEAIYSSWKHPLLLPTFSNSMTT
jgi:hypothetical protein